MIFGKLLNLSGLHARCCKPERLAEGNFKESNNVEVPGEGQRGAKVIQGCNKGATAQSRGSVLDGSQTVSHETLGLFQRPT